MMTLLRDGMYLDLRDFYEFIIYFIFKKLISRFLFLGTVLFPTMHE